MKKLGKLNLKKEKMLSHEELVSFRGGSGDDCTGFGTNKCNADCPCTSAEDWCVNNKFETRP